MLDLNRPVQLRNGTPARIVCTDRRSVPEANRVLVVLIMNKIAGYEEARYYRLDGKSSPNGESPADLINVPIIKARWVFVNSQHGGSYVTGLVTREEAIKFLSGSVVQRPDDWYLLGKVEGTEIEE